MVLKDGCGRCGLCVPGPSLAEGQRGDLADRSLDRLSLAKAWSSSRAVPRGGIGRMSAARYIRPHAQRRPISCFSRVQPRTAPPDAPCAQSMGHHKPPKPSPRRKMSIKQKLRPAKLTFGLDGVLVVICNLTQVQMQMLHGNSRGTPAVCQRVHCSDAHLELCI